MPAPFASDTDAQALRPNRPDVAALVNVTLALVLLVAAVLKAALAFSATPSAMPIRHPLLLLALIQAEVLLSTWLLVGGAAVVRFFVAMTCFCLFAGYAVYEALHAIPSCGCFGNVKVPPLLTATFDASAVAALWFTRPRGSHAQKKPSRTRFLAGITIGLFSAIGLCTGYFAKYSAKAMEPDDLVILDPTSWPNHTFPLLDNIGGASETRKGRWVLVLYHHDCDSCRRAIPAYCSMAGQKKGAGWPRLAFIQMPPIVAPADDPVPKSAQYLHLNLPPSHLWFATTPVAVLLDNGVVKAASSGKAAETPNPSWWPGGG